MARLEPRTRYHLYRLLGTRLDYHKFKVGDKVIILPLSTEEKRNYPAGWNNYMDKYENHEGVITQVVAGWPDTYEISGTNFYQWHASHLVPPTVFVPY